MKSKFILNFFLNFHSLLVNNFKSIIQLKRYIHVEPIKRPEKEENRKVEEPAFVEKYLKLKKKQLKRKRREIQNSILSQVDPELNIKLEETSVHEEFIQPKKKKSKK